MLDISKKEVLEKYLLDRNLINEKNGYSLSYLGGGVSCTVAFVHVGEKEIIVKQALKQLKTKETWFSDPNRMKAEYESNKIYNKLMPKNAPEVYFYDEANYIYAREAAPEDSSMWKSDLLSGLIDYEVATKAIKSLVEVHNYCANNSKVAEEFKDKQIFYELRISPYIEFIVQKYPEIESFANPISSELMKSNISLVHGDFSPKNIMTDNRKIWIIDYEVAHYGHPAFDLAFFSNHFILKAVKNKQWAASYINLLSFMLETYFEKESYMDKVQLETSFIKLLSLLMIARVDGKSPVEYITDEKDKNIIRDLAFFIINEGIVSYDEVIKLVISKVTN